MIEVMGVAIRSLHTSPEAA